MRSTLDFRSMAEACFKKAGGNVLKAKDTMAAMVRKDDALFRALMDPLVEEACYSFLRGLGRSQNQEVWRASQEGREVHERKIVEVFAEGLLGWVVLGGKTLGDCTREDLDRAIKHYRDQAVDMSHKARWLELVRDAVPAGKKVKEVLSARKLQSLQKKAA